MPGHEKIVSVTIAPVNRNGISRPMFVTNRQQGIAEGVLHHDAPLGTPLARAVPDVVLAQRVQHGGPHETRVARDADHDKRDHGQDKVLDQVDEREHRLLADECPVVRRPEDGHVACAETSRRRGTT